MNKMNILNKMKEKKEYIECSLRVDSDKMRCDLFAAKNRMRFTHAPKKINETNVIQ